MRRIVLLLLTALPAVVLTQTPQFRSAVDLVHLDVSVLDKNRAPVRGLTRADFTILEDGQPRNVDNFVAVDVPPPPPAPPPNSWMRTVAADVQTNDIARTPEGRLVVLLLDDVMIPADPAMIAATGNAFRIIPCSENSHFRKSGTYGARIFGGSVGENPKLGR